MAGLFRDRDDKRDPEGSSGRPVPQHKRLIAKLPAVLEDLDILHVSGYVEKAAKCLCAGEGRSGSLHSRSFAADSERSGACGHSRTPPDGDGSETVRRKTCRCGYRLRLLHRSRPSHEVRRIPRRRSASNRKGRCDGEANGASRHVDEVLKNGITREIEFDVQPQKNSKPICSGCHKQRHCYNCLATRRLEYVLLQAIAGTLSCRFVLSSKQDVAASDPV